MVKKCQCGKLIFLKDKCNDCISIKNLEDIDNETEFHMNKCDRCGMHCIHDKCLDCMVLPALGGAYDEDCGVELFYCYDCGAIVSKPGICKECDIDKPLKMRREYVLITDVGKFFEGDIVLIELMDGSKVLGEILRIINNRLDLVLGFTRTYVEETVDYEDIKTIEIFST